MKNGRPEILSEFIGNENVKQQLAIILKSVRKSNSRMEHVLLYGFPGTGKTTLARIIANELGNPIITITGNTIKSQEELANLLSDMFYKWQATKKPVILFVDECLPYGTLIVKDDGGVEEIQNLTTGNLYCGNAITANMKRKTKELVRIQTADGIIVSTPTHPHVTSKNIVGKKRIENGCQLQKGEYLFTAESIPHTTRKSWTPEQLAFVGLLIADGCITTGKYKCCGKRNVPKRGLYPGNSMQFSFRKEEHYNRARELTEKAINTFSVKPVSWTCSHNRDFTIRIYGKDFIQNLCEKFAIQTGNAKKYNTTINDEVFYSPIESIKSFVDTVLFFEGCNAGWSGSRKTSRSISMVSYDFVARFQLLLKKLSVQTSLTRIHTPSMRKRNATPVFRLTVKRVKRNTIEINGKKFLPSKIKAVDRFSTDEYVYDYQTETHYFVANGFLTHNCHTLVKAKELDQTVWFPLLEDFIFYNNLKGKRWEYNGQLVEGTNNEAKNPPFTCIGATTNVSDLDSALRRRFAFHMYMKPYTDSELALIVKNNAESRGINITESACLNIARRSRYTPATALSYLQNCYHYMIAEDKQVIDDYVINFTMDMQGIDEEGLKWEDLQVLKALAENEKGMGFANLAGTASVQKDVLTDIIEPFLKSKQLIKTTNKRMITEKGMAYINNSKKEALINE